MAPGDMRAGSVPVAIGRLAGDDAANHGTRDETADDRTRMIAPVMMAGMRPVMVMPMVPAMPMPDLNDIAWRLGHRRSRQPKRRSRCRSSGQCREGQGKGKSEAGGKDAFHVFLHSFAAHTNGTTHRRLLQHIWRPPFDPGFSGTFADKTVDCLIQWRHCCVSSAMIDILRASLRNSR